MVSKIYKVIDVNCFGKENLVNYLSASKDNIAVVTDYAPLELYKGNSIEHLHRKIKQIYPYVDQFIVLKSTPTIYKMKRLENKSYRLIDKNQTQYFKEYLKPVERVKEHPGIYNFNAQILYAQAFEAEASSRAKKWSDNFSLVVSSYTDGELKVIRSGLEYSPALAEKIIRNIVVTAHEKFERRLSRNEIPKSLDVALDMYLFRYAIVTYAWFVVNLRNGVQKLKQKDMISDNSDFGYITYATYYDDFMTLDARAYEIYEQTIKMLDWLKALVLEAKTNNIIYTI